MLRLGINGLGRIGRLAFRVAALRSDVEIIAVNDLNPKHLLIPLIERDSIYGRFAYDFDRVRWIHEEPMYQAQCWDGVDIVLDSAGGSPDGAKARQHLQQGARHVVISAPSENVDAVLVMGVNEGNFRPEYRIISMASCTTNCVAPILKALQPFDIASVWLDSINAYTNAQRIVDAPHNDLRRARAAALNIIPTESSTGNSIFKLFPDLKQKFGARAFRVPVACGSVISMSVQFSKIHTVDEVYDALRLYKVDYPQIMDVSLDPLVSSDIIGDSHSCVIDYRSTVYDINTGTLHIMAWYDNELAYATRLVDLASYIGQRSPLVRERYPVEMYEAP